MKAKACRCSASLGLLRHLANWDKVLNAANVKQQSWTPHLNALSLPFTLGLLLMRGELIR